jgi:hypothetical protein
MNYSSNTCSRNHEETFINISQKLWKVKTREKRKFNEELFKTGANTWTKLHKVLGTKRKDGNISEIFDSAAGRIIKDTEEIANVFNQHFISICERLAEQFDEARIVQLRENFTNVVNSENLILNSATEEEIFGISRFYAY